jgi:hypothetical protein
MPAFGDLPSRPSGTLTLLSLVLDEQLQRKHIGDTPER